MASIVIQRGHYPRTSGATGTAGRDADPTEQEFAVAAAAACATRLRAAGHAPVVINADVPDWQYTGQAFVAIHCDGSVSDSARGASVGYRTAEGMALGAAFKRHYQAQGWPGGWRPDNYTAALAGYYGTGRAVAQGNRRAIIVEAGFLTNPQDEAWLQSVGADRLAIAITAAVVDQLGGIQAEVPPEVDMIIVDCAGRPALFVAGPDDIQRLNTPQRDALRGIGVPAKTVNTAQHDALWSLTTDDYNPGDFIDEVVRGIVDKVVPALAAQGGRIDQATVEAGVRAAFAKGLEQ